MDEAQAERELWFNWWRDRAQVVEDLEKARSYPDASMLIYGGLEALAQWWEALVKLTFRSAKRRFGEFLVTASANTDVFDRVSLPSIWDRAKTDPRLTASEQSLLASYERKSGSRGDPIRSLRDDPLRSSLLDASSPLAGFSNNRLLDKHGNRSGELGVDWLLDSRIGELLYERFRCPWIHEMRPGNGTSGFRGETPGYFSARYACPGSLDFPFKFMVGIYRRCIASVQEIAQREGLRPARIGEPLGWS